MYIKDKSRISIDWNCELFHNLLFRHFITRRPDLSDILFQNKRIRNTATNTWPTLLHASGNTRMGRFVSELGYDVSLALPKKDIKNYSLKACFHLGKVLKYLLAPTDSASQDWNF